MHEWRNWKPIGFYTLEDIYFDSSIEREILRDAIWVDLDIYGPGMRSIGHHLQNFTLNDEIPNHAASLNPNLRRGTYYYTFRQKYPIGSIHFLVWFFDYQLKKDKQNKLLFWHPDSSWINGQSHRYRDNVEDWLFNLVPNELMTQSFEVIDTEAFEEDMKSHLYPKIKNTGFTKGKGQVSSRHLNLRGYQCTFDDPTEKLGEIQGLISLISEITGWDEMPLPKAYDVISGVRQGTTYKSLRSNFGNLDTFLEEKDVFSYSIPNRNRMNYTTQIQI